MRQIFFTLLAAIFLSCPTPWAQEAASGSAGNSTANGSSGATIAATAEPVAPKSYSPESILRETLNPPPTTEDRQAKLRDLFAAAGADPASARWQLFSWKGQTHRNLIFELPGGDCADGKRLIVVGAHTDSDESSNGAIDNWSGCTTLAALYGRLKGEQLRHRFVFIGFGCEEHGQAGSDYYVDELGRKGRKSVKAMVNLECLGVEGLRSWANRSADDLQALLAAAATEAEMPASQEVLFGYSADSFTFTRSGIPSLTAHSLSWRTLHLINTPLDKPGCINADRLLESYRLLSAFLLHLDRYAGEIRPANSREQLEPVSAELRGVDREGNAAGVLIPQVREESREYQAGLRPGDVVLKVDGEAIAQAVQLPQWLLTRYRGQRATLTIMRPEDQGSAAATGEAGCSQPGTPAATQPSCREIVIEY